MSFFDDDLTPSERYIRDAWLRRLMRESAPPIPCPAERFGMSAVQRALDCGLHRNAVAMMPPVSLG